MLTWPARFNDLIVEGHFITLLFFTTFWVLFFSNDHCLITCLFGVFHLISIKFLVIFPFYFHFHLFVCLIFHYHPSFWSITKPFFVFLIHWSLLMTNLAVAIFVHWGSLGGWSSLQWTIFHTNIAENQR